MLQCNAQLCRSVGLVAKSHNLHHRHPPELACWNDSSAPHATLHGPVNGERVTNEKKAHVTVHTLNLPILH